MFDFFHTTNEVLTERGVTLPLPPQSTTAAETRFGGGRALQQRILGDTIDRLYAESPKAS